MTCKMSATDASVLIRQRIAAQIFPSTSMYTIRSTLWVDSVVKRLIFSAINYKLYRFDYGT